MRKTKPWLLAIAMLCCSLTASAEVVDGINYYFDSSSLTAEVISSSPKYSGDIVIPESVTYNGNEYRVTSIGDDAFNSCYLLTSIEIPNSVMSIGSFAFRCSSLTSIVIPNSVTSIGDYAFYNCSSLTSIEIPNSVTSIGDYAFEECSSLTSIEIPNRVTSVGDYAFSSCPALTSITIGNSVTSIGKSAFSYCNSLTSIEIPNSVTSIGESAFSGCSSLKKVTLGSGLTSMGYGILGYCSSLNTIKVDAANTAFCVEEGALYNITKSELICYPAARRNILFSIPNSVTKIWNYTFYKASNLTSIIMGDSVTSIGHGAFQDCTGLTSITIPNSVTSIGNGAFMECTRLTSVIIGNSVTSIGHFAFQDCTGLTSITIPGSVTSIGNSAFYGCYRVKRLTFEEGIKSIPGGAFSAMGSQPTIDLPSTITSIEVNSFYSPADSLIVRSSTPPTIWDTSFGSGAPYESCTVYVPAESLEDYMEDYDWGYLFTKFAPIEGGEAVNTFPITISSGGYATYYGESAIQVPTGMTAYYGKLSKDNKWLNLYEITEGKVPAKCGVVLKADPGTYSCIQLEESIPAISGNALFGYTTEVDASILTGIGFNLYTLAQEDGVVGFYKYTGSKLLPNKVFLRLDSSLSAPKMRIMGSETGITEVDREPAADASVIYDLQGRRVSDMSRKGIYVVEGKKVIVK